MATVLKAPEQPSAPAPAATSTPLDSESKGLATDWAALIVWVLCFAFMALLHLKDLLVCVFR
jgi:hypothetical protein